MKLGLGCMVGCLILTGSAGAAPPTIWMGPPSYDNGRCFRELFEHPDQWATTRGAVDVLCYTDLNFNKQFKDDELKAWFAQLAAWKIKLGLEVGAIKPWNHTGAGTFAIERPMWERVERLGGHIHAIALDEPLLCCREHIHQSDDFALQETANYIAAVRQAFPAIQIGDIETYPSLTLRDHLWWIEALNQRLAERHVRGLDFYRLDVNWVNFIVQNQGAWREVRQVELACRQRHLPFSLIYWASGYPGLEKRGLADDSTWYVGLMAQGYAYALVDGHPDQYVIESWLGAPTHCVPETTLYTFTHTVHEFVQKFVPRAP